MANVPNLGIDGEDLEGVYDAIEFVKETKTKPIITDNLLGKELRSLVPGIQRLMLRLVRFV